MTPRRLVKDTLEFRNGSFRAPRQLWLLPWAQSRHPEMVERLNREFAWDIASPAVEYAAIRPPRETPTRGASLWTNGAAAL